MSNRSRFVTALFAASMLMFAGCAAERHEVVPSSAMLGAEGEKLLTYTTSGPGTIYIYDQSDDKLLYSGRVESRRQVTIDPERNEITVDGILVQDKTVKARNNRKIYFQPTVR